MLSRTAENLYWTGRYIERAENMARILDVSQRLAVQGRPNANDNSEWIAVLAILEAQGLYANTHGDVTEDGVIAFLTLDRSNPSSIWNCVRAARENARALRATISVELWESLNTTWLHIRDMDDAGLQARGLREFYDWVKERSHLFRGVTHGTMLHNDSFGFTRLGTFIERADNTARLLDTKYHLLAQGGSDNDPAANYYEWGAVLRSVGAFRAYHQVYHDVITPSRVAELLVLRPEMPRSLRFCFDKVTEMLAAVSDGRQLECERLSGEFGARLRYGRMESILGDGLHEFLMEVLDRTAEVSEQISRDFMMSV
ncbi:MAG TPA: alpha-E domain-containing protein [Patescibacteria group bacterium]|nr:alpha-E domain-containing protein [Patescibacteria group bacterium]